MGFYKFGETFFMQIKFKFFYIIELSSGMFMGQHEVFYNFYTTNLFKVIILFY